MSRLKELLKQMRNIGFTHYTKEDMLGFPYLERKRITAVPSVLWSKHDEISLKIKMVLDLYETSKDEDA